MRTNLLILMALVGSLLLADRLREIVQERNADIALARAELTGKAKSGAERQADLISEARAILRLATSLPEREGTSLTGCQVPFRHLVADRPWLLSMSVVHPTGKAICTSSDRLVAQNLADREYFQSVLKTRDFVVSDYIISRLTHKPVIIVAMPRMAHGKVQAVVVASIDIEWLGRIAADTDARGGAEVLLIDTHGTVIAAHPDAKRWIGRNVAGDRRFWSALAEPDGAFESAALDGERRVVSHAKLPQTGAVLAVMQKREDVLGQANFNARYSLAKMGIAGMFGFLVVWLGGERLVLRPIGELTAGARRIGLHDLQARVDTRGFSPELRLLGDTFNNMAAQLSEHELELRRANLRLSELASTDALTGLPNRRSFDEHIETEWRRGSRTGECLALLMIDVDEFKKFNDRYGHLEGDDCLRQVAAVLNGAGRRPPDLAARTGGEEFAVMLPGARLKDAVRVAENVRAAIAGLQIKHLDSAGGRVSVSIGVAAAQPRADASVRTLLDAADAALYRAKRSGRNRVAFETLPVALAS